MSVRHFGAGLISFAFILARPMYPLLKIITKTAVKLLFLIFYYYLWVPSCWYTAYRLFFFVFQVMIGNPAGFRGCLGPPTPMPVFSLASTAASLLFSFPFDIHVQKTRILHGPLQPHIYTHH